MGGGGGAVININEKMTVNRLPLPPKPVLFLCWPGEGVGGRGPLPRGRGPLPQKKERKSRFFQ